MGDKDRLWRHAVAVEAKTTFRPAHESLHDIGDVAHVQPGTMESAIGCFTA